MTTRPYSPPLTWYLTLLYAFLSLGATFPSQSGFTLWGINLLLVISVRLLAVRGL